MNGVLRGALLSAFRSHNLLILSYNRKTITSLMDQSLSIYQQAYCNGIVPRSFIVVDLKHFEETLFGIDGILVLYLYCMKVGWYNKYT